MFLNQIRKGEILIAEEWRAGLRYLAYGPVSAIIDGNVVIKDEEGMRSFSLEKLWTIPAYIEKIRRESLPIRQLPNEQRDNNGMKALMGGFIVSVAEGKVNGAVLQEVAKELRKQGVMPAAPQELIGAL